MLWVLCPCVGCVRRVCGKGSCVPCMAYRSATRLVCAVCGVERVGLSSELVFDLRLEFVCCVWRVGRRLEFVFGVLCRTCPSTMRICVLCVLRSCGVLVCDEDGVCRYLIVARRLAPLCLIGAFRRLRCVDVTAQYVRSS